MQFGHLIYPLSTKLFIEEYWQKRPLLVRDRDRDYYTSLIKMADIDRIIYSLQPDWKQLRLIKQGGFFPKSFMNPDGSPNLIKIYQAYQKGYSVILYGLEQQLTPLSALARNLEDFFNHAVRVDVFLTPSNSQALVPHFDGEDVLILQVEGTKHWRVYEPLPTDEFVARELADDTALPKDNLPPLAMDIWLEPGDLLYLPRGWGHEVSTGTCSSLQIGISVFIYTWSDLLSALLSSLQRENIDFRRALPAGFLNEGKIKPEQLEELLQVLAEQANLDSAIEQLKMQLLARTPNPLPNGDFQRLERANLEAALTRQIQGE
ncbi:MAG: hypothetical protein F6K37_14160 [Moorea sp. SIO4E2]|uniref:cupin domain-containing protein n=1 Tax=Moorena sp. SIO4E2 TaxID=2607826 RepID=UPI0013BAC21B|nr:cupin domain-containing protein [Moorena sp. SIO4E2]NEQ07039.1 hypothetical protein [Moorena sp. SIO4E2]